MADSNLIWIDLEMTGLHPEKDRIIEMATIVTDSHLNILAEGPVFAIKQSDELIAGMDEWNTRQHHASGLVERVKASLISESEAEKQTLDFLKMWTTAGKSPLCGNSVWQDRRFLAKYMPELESHCHYRLIDVSTIKELALRWSPRVYQGVNKESQHLALSDIRDSISELKHYQAHFFKLPDA